MKKTLLILLTIIFAAGFSVYAFETSKPASHNSTWERMHGKEAKANEEECLACHEDRLECIACHEDVSPRSHTASWTAKGHTLEARWNKQKCAVCHKEDFCSACHESAYPRNHSVANFRGGANTHCTSGCQLPFGVWTNTPSKNCIVCHKTRPTPNGGQHAMN